VPDSLGVVTVWEALAILLAGVGAGTINTVVGSGTLITFPVLLALGYPPVTANVSNNIGLVFGSISGTWGYRRELAGTRHLLVRLAPASFVGAVIGAVLLLRLPATAFETIVPVLIAIALVLVLVQPRIAAANAARRERTGAGHPGVGPVAQVGTLLAGVYGGYFGAAQGVLLVGLLGALLAESLQRVNGIKNLLSAVVNGVAAVTFLVIAPGEVDWRVAGLIAVGSIGGGFIGAGIGRRLPPSVLRGVIVVVGLTAIVRLLWFA
jgi:uncharacterized membrane protein YfcA